MNGICPGCNQFKALTKHHVLPRRHFGLPLWTPYIWICRTCHDQLELLIPKTIILPEKYYYKVIIRLTGNTGFGFSKAHMAKIEP